MVRDGFNGFALPEDATPADFADAVEGLWTDRKRYRALRMSSRLEYEERLNWETWAKAIASRIEALDRRLV